MTNLLKEFKAYGVMAIAAIFFLTITMSSCGDSKKDSTEEATTTEETVAPVEDHDAEHPTDHEHTGDEHPTDGDEHPSTEME